MGKSDSGQEKSTMIWWLVGIVSTICLSLGAWALASTSENKAKIESVSSKTEDSAADIADIKKDIRDIKNFLMSNGKTKFIH